MTLGKLGGLVVGGSICFAGGACRYGLVALSRGLVSTVSLLALTVPGTVLAQQTPDMNLPEVRVIATSPASAVSSPRRARAEYCSHRGASNRQCAPH